MSNSRAFEGIWIPKDIWLSTELTLQEKVFYVEIKSLDNEHGCFANNQYFADFFGLSKVRVSEVINSLVEKGYLISTVDQASGNRRILKTLIKESLRPLIKESLRPHKDSFKHNNTDNNTKEYINNAHARKIDVDDGNPNAAIERDLEETLFWIQRQKGLKTIKSIPETEWISAIESVAAEGISGEEFKNYYQFLAKLDWIQTVSPKIVTGQVERYLKRDEIKAKQSQAKAPEARPKSGIIW